MIKLILKSFHRHTVNTNRLVVLMSLCLTVIIVGLSFVDSFYCQYIDLGINTQTAHLGIVSPDSPKINSNTWQNERQDLPLIYIDNDIKEFILGLPEIEIALPVIETRCSFFHLNGEYQSNSNLIGINPEKIFFLFPALRVVDGSHDFTWYPDNQNIPVLRLEKRPWEIINKNDEFIRKDFKISKEAMEEFKALVVNDFQELFSITDYRGETGTQKFLYELNNSLSNTKIFQMIPEKYLQQYNWEIDDIVYQIKNFDKEIIKNDIINKKRYRTLNRKLLTSLYPEQLAKVKDEIFLNLPMTLKISPAKSSPGISPPIVMPVTFTGFVKSLPLYSRESFIDIRSIYEFLDIDENQCTTFFIRLKHINQTEKIKLQIQNYIKKKGMNYTVIDFKIMGKEYIPTVYAFVVAIGILIILFILTLCIFIINMVILSIIKRKKEIGTSIAIGMSKNENIFLFLGEVFLIFSLSWIIAGILSSILIIIFSEIGISGIIFFIDEKLFFIFKIQYLLISYAIILPIVLLTAFIPCLSIKKKKVIELLKVIK